MPRSAVLGLALAVALATACSDNNPSNAAHDAGAAVTPREDIRLSAEDQTFVMNAAKGNQMEADLAEMAKGKADNDAVEDFAQQLERDHNSVLEDLRRIADKADIKLDDQPPVEKASMTSKLDAATGPAFDREYVSMMVEAHKKNIATFEQKQMNATGEVKALIDKALPVMREHLQKAEALMAQLGK
jgi:putative membrane protein